MYEYIVGKLIEKKPTAAVVEASGVGYHIMIPVPTFAALPELGQTVRILTHFIVREDAQALFGFFCEEERQLFRLLLSVSGVGPKSAMTILSGVQIPELKRAIVEGNLAVLTGIPGVGRKTAERLVIELREKIVLEDRRDGVFVSAKSSPEEAVFEDSLRALVELGYRKQAAQDAVQKAVKQSGAEPMTLPDLIRASLKFV